jgi:hypothetical protein
MTVVRTEDVLEKEAQVLHGIGDWRSAHSWLKGYSDAQRDAHLGDAAEHTYDPAAYRRGAEAGMARRTAEAMANAARGVWEEA